MAMDQARCRSLLKDFGFTALFVEELGWDRHSQTLDIPIGDQVFTLSALAQKRGMIAFLCDSGRAAMPDYAMRRKIETQVAKSVHEHLIIYADAEKSRQVWQWVKREPGKPAQCREHIYYRGQPGDSLLQKLQVIAFSLEEEEGLTLTLVTAGVRAAFDVEKVTKRFYDRFKAEHAIFSKFVKGIPDDWLHRWYVSVTLNRLMFIYFIQKKGFLNADQGYLRNKLAESRRRGKDRFYREFLCPLFFEGFAKQESERSAATSELLGKVPYLNGGIFLRHQIEEAHGETIQIADAAFEKLFEFFDAYQWHLDERPLRADNEINPDVLGYIFEKYINAIQPGEQKAKGAYYTKEDITGYISQNTVIPFLFDAARRKCRGAFEGDSSVWRLLRENPDRYIYEPVRRGVIGAQGEIVPESALPDFVRKGMHDPKARMFERRYNLGDADLRDHKGNKLTLPTETWREYVCRRQRCLELREKLAAGEVKEINDLITYNLDIRQFAQDVIEECEDPELLRAFWQAIEQVTVLDPTCGSGAFLFAALNVLEPLYEACLERMEALLEELERSGKKHSPKKLDDFRQVLARVEQHPNRRYFILKTIILNNLYGVDIMEEAIEICKLRLFLKLVAQLEPTDRIEPLPDIDFNIRAGNTLVGYATYDQVKQAVGSKFDYEGAMERIEEKAQDLDRLFERFREQQTSLGGEVTATDKANLRERLVALEGELNRYLAEEYVTGLSRKAEEYAAWLRSHKPFHWFIEFHEIMSKGGFDVIIGNPPYVAYSAIRQDYEVLRYDTAACGNLYAFVFERALALLGQRGWASLIVMLNLTFAEVYAPLRQHIARKTGTAWVSSYDNIPDGLFSGSDKPESTNTSKVVSQRVAIAICQAGASTRCRVHTSHFLRWNRDFRPCLFPTLQLGGALLAEGQPWPALGSPTALSVFGKVNVTGKEPLGTLISSGQQRLQLGATPRYFISAVPDDLNRSGIVELPFPSKLNRMVAECILNSNLFYWYWRATGDGFHLTKTTIASFPVPAKLRDDDERLASVAKLLAEVRPSCRTSKLNKGRLVHNVNYNLAPAAMRQADRILGSHLGLTDEELDFIINYDIKYRMGREESDGD